MQCYNDRGVLQRPPLQHRDVFTNISFYLPPSGAGLRSDIAVHVDRKEGFACNMRRNLGTMGQNFRIVLVRKKTSCQRGGCEGAKCFRAPLQPLLVGFPRAITTPLGKLEREKLQ